MPHASSHLPRKALNKKGVFTLYASSTIDAPIDRVWATLLDFPKYSEWNSFVREQSIVDANKRPIPDAHPEPGQRLYMSRVHIPPSMKDDRIKPSTALEVITTVDHENFHLSWKNEGSPKFLLSAERWQVLSEPRPGQTEYETIETFGGTLAYLVKWLYERHLEKGFNAMARDLKKKCEKDAQAARHVDRS